MVGFLFIMLPLSLLVVFIVALIAFGDVACRQVPLSVSVDQIQFSQSPLAEITTYLKHLSVGGSCRGGTYIPEVTNVEAVAIVRELRSQGSNRLESILEKSRQHQQSCPMLMASGICACSMTRPLACVDHCSVGGDSPEWISGLGTKITDAFHRHLESQKIDSATRRLDEAILTLIDSSNDQKA